MARHSFYKYGIWFEIAILGQFLVALVTFQATSER